MIIGITGSIGSGKSEVAKVFAENGAIVIDADEVAKAQLKRGKKGFVSVVGTFGKDILDKEGNIDTKHLAEKVFADPDKVEAINALIHPLVGKAIKRKVRNIRRRIPDAMIVIDAPLLIEAGFHRWVDHLILVVPKNPEEAIVRAAKRIGIPLREARRRFSFQMPLHEKEKVADTIIVNDGTLDMLREKARNVFIKMIKKEEIKKV